MAFPTGWTRRCALTIDHTKVTASQTDFPVLVGYNAVGSETNLPTEMLVTSGANAAKSDGSDIRFSSDLAGTSPLHCEVVLWTQHATTDASRHAEIWVKCDPSSSVDTIIYVWYGNASATAPTANDATFGSQGVWDSNYKIVCHLSDGSTLNVNDSTSNANNLTNSSCTAAAGAIDGGATMGGTAQLTRASFASPASITVQCWVLVTTLAGQSGNGTGLVSMQPNDGSFPADNWQLTINPSGTPGFLIFQGGSTQSQQAGANASINTKYLIHGTYNGTNLVCSINGSSSSSSPGGTMNTNTTTVVIGNLADGVFGLKGWIDEVRISNIARSSTWISTEYANQNSPSTFLTVGIPASVGNVNRRTFLGFRTGTRTTR